MPWKSTTSFSLISITRVASESLNLALENYEGTLLFVSHDREFVSSLATRVIEIKENEVVDFHGTYAEYLASQGIVGA